MYFNDERVQACSVLSHTGCCSIVTRLARHVRQSAAQVSRLVFLAVISRKSRLSLENQHPLWLIQDPLLGSEMKCLEIAKVLGSSDQLSPQFDKSKGRVATDL